MRLPSFILLVIALLPCETSSKEVASLEQELKDQPLNHERMLELAQAYEKENKLFEAITLCKKFLGDGEKPEAWGAMYLIGTIYEKQDFWDQAVHWYHLAFEKDPNIPDPIYRMAIHFRLLGQNNLATLYALRALECEGSPPSWLSNPVHPYQIDEELSIAAFYTPYREAGFDAANRLMLQKGLPERLKRQTENNFHFFVPILNNRELHEIPFQSASLTNAMDNHKLIDPIIRQSDNGYHLLCSISNPNEITDIDIQSFDPANDLLYPRYFLFALDHDFHVLSQGEITHNPPKPWSSLTNESYGAQFFFLIAPHLSELTTPIEEVMSLHSETPLPSLRNHDLLRLIFSNPSIIAKFNTETNRLDTQFSNPPAIDMSHFKGSAPLIPFDSGYLAVAREMPAADQPISTHRFMFLDQSYNIAEISIPFFLKGKGKEYCGGITLDHSGKNLIISCTLEDQKPSLIIVDIDDIRSLLEPINPSEYLLVEKEKS